ncbi:Thiol:disulfide interchange protein DsbD [invertebrate metagenome]|uniref:Thiol:disulfide interchange protein DsbD n=1 Tax=invertebrate metagenome TaxID=1711999 RepID=A0A2H9T917_9ZZZZ
MGKYPVLPAKIPCLLSIRSCVLNFFLTCSTYNNCKTTTQTIIMIKPAITRWLFPCLVLLLAIFSKSALANKTLDQLLAPRDSTGTSSFLPVSDAFDISGFWDGQQVFIDVDVAPGHYLYKNRFSINSTDSIQLNGKPIYPQGKDQFDANFNETVTTFTQSFTLKIPATLIKSPPAIQISYQGCASSGLCYPPQKRLLSLQILPDVQPTDRQNIENERLKDTQTTPLESESFYQEQLEQSNFLIALMFFFIAGIGLSFTPCVLPMLPIVSSIIVGAGNTIKRRSVLLTTVYSLAMSGTLALAGTITGLLGASFNLQAKLQSPWVIIPMVVLFIVLAMSMFGLYELQMPASIRNRMGQAQNKKGSIWGALLLGILSALVVSPCVSAPLAGALLYISTTGNAFLGGLTLFALGLGMSIPFFCLALGGRKLLPKAGAWMDRVKVFFGLLMLGVAIWMLDRLISDVLTLALWGLLAISGGLFFRALDIPVKSSRQIAQQSFGIALLVYGICMIIGSTMNHSDPLKPLAATYSSVTAASALTSDDGQRKTSSVYQLNQLLKQAAESGKPAVVDITADWCQACKVIENTVFPDSKVAPLLQQVFFIRFDITDNTREQQAFLNQHRFFGPPALLFYYANGLEEPDAQLHGNITVPRLTNSLITVLTEQEN